MSPSGRQMKAKNTLGFVGVKQSTTDSVWRKKSCVLVFIAGRKQSTALSLPSGKCDGRLWVILQRSPGASERNGSSEGRRIRINAINLHHPCLLRWFSSWRRGEIKYGHIHLKLSTKGSFSGRQNNWAPWLRWAFGQTRRWWWATKAFTPPLWRSDPLNRYQTQKGTLCTFSIWRNLLAEMEYGINKNVIFGSHSPWQGCFTDIESRPIKRFTAFMQTCDSHHSGFKGPVLLFTSVPRPCVQVTSVWFQQLNSTKSTNKRNKEFRLI